jgi:hypothetical protein
VFLATHARCTLTVSDGDEFQIRKAAGDILNVSSETANKRYSSRYGDG